ncbi:hypothetical protein [Actinomadura sp. NPDC049753]
MATQVRKRRNRKWWVLEVGTNKEISGPYDTKEEAEEARDAAKS